MIEGSKVILRVDLSVYDKIAALKACYVFQDRCHSSLEKDSNTVLRMTLVPRSISADLKEIEQQIMDELIDQQIRLENEKLFSDIRKLIVEQAFRPVGFKALKMKLKK